MRPVIFGFIACAALSTTALSQSQPDFPAGAEALAAQLKTRIGPQTLAWIEREAASELTTGTVSEAAAGRAARANGEFHKLGNGDVMALAFLVMMQAAKSSREDLTEIMADVAQINKAKAALREKQRAVQTAQSAAATPSVTPPRTQRSRNPTRGVILPRPIPKAEFDRRLSGAKDDSALLDELGERELLRLQMLMDRMMRLMSALSNVQKSLPGTSASVMQNLK